MRLLDGRVVVVTGGGTGSAAPSLSDAPLPARAWSSTTVHVRGNQVRGVVAAGAVAASAFSVTAASHAVRQIVPVHAGTPHGFFDQRDDKLKYPSVDARTRVRIFVNNNIE